MSDLFASLSAAKQQADSSAAARENYARFLVYQRDVNGWTPEEMADYKEKIGVIMGKDDAAALALFPAGLYKTADEARQGARIFWQAWCDMMLPRTILT